MPDLELRLRSNQSRTNITPIPTSTFLSISGPSISESISHINTQYPAASDSSSHLPRSQWRKQPRRAGKLKAAGTNRMSLSHRLEPCRILNRLPMQYPQLQTKLPRLRRGGITEVGGRRRTEGHPSLHRQTRLALETALTCVNLLRRLPRDLLSTGLVNQEGET